MKDQLYLLKPGFKNAGLGPFYCNDSTPVEGFLSFFPQMRTLVDVHYVEFPRPRGPLVAALGEDHQSLPVLILTPESVVKDPALKPASAKGKRYFADERSIRQYLATRFSFPVAS